MRIGILADIHEAVEPLRWALGVLADQGAGALVVLGDVCGMDSGLDETVGLLTSAHAIGVWGNHDFGLCHTNQRPEDRRRYAGRTLDFMAGLRPRLELDGCLFTHVEPWLDPESLEDLWYFDGPPVTPEQSARSFTAVTNRLMFVGHYHRWLLTSPEGQLPWSGETPIHLDPRRRFLVAVQAVCDGGCALFDTATSELVPFNR